MSALTEKIKRLATSTNFYNEVIEILLELEARQPNYVITLLPSSPIPSGPVIPYQPYLPDNTNPFINPIPTRPRIGDWPPSNGVIYTSNPPAAQSDPTGWVESTPTTEKSKPVGYGG